MLISTTKNFKLGFFLEISTNFFSGNGQSTFNINRPTLRPSFRAFLTAAFAILDVAPYAIIIKSES
jgi:hypothetical protein